MLQMMDMTGKTALVCGASQGIGHAAALSLSELGCRVLLLARNAQNLKAVQQQLKPVASGAHEVWATDLSKPEELVALVAKIKAQPIHVLINNTGGPKGGPLLSAEAQEFVEAFQNHVVVAQKLTQAVMPGMTAAKYGRIVNVISTSVKAPIANLGVSNTIRAAMANWAKTLASEVAAHGVTVNNVLPGFTQTARLDQLRKGNAERLKISEEQVSDQWLATIPARRFGQAWELGAAIAFLASPAAGYITGINLPVDGGRTPSL